MCMENDVHNGCFLLLRPKTYAWKPVLPVSYSPSTLGGVLAATALLPLCREFGLQVTPGSVSIASVSKALDAEGTLQAGFEHLQVNLRLTILNRVFW